MKSKNIRLVLIFLVFFPEIGLSSGQGFYPNQKSLSSEGCAPGTEFKIRHKGVRGCYPIEKTKEDPRCNSDFIEKFSAQQDCLIGADEISCLYLGIVAGSSSVGALFGSVLKKLNPKKEFLNRYKNVYKEMQRNESQKQKILSNLKSARVKAAENLTKELTGVEPKRNLDEIKDEFDPGDADQKYRMRLKSERDEYLMRNAKDRSLPSRWVGGGREDRSIELKATKELLLQEFQGPENESSRQIIEKNFRTASNPELDLATAIDKKTQKFVEDEFGRDKLIEYEKIHKQYLDKAQAARLKFDPTYEADIKVLRDKEDKIANDPAKRSQFNDILSAQRDRHLEHNKIMKPHLVAIESEFRSVLRNNHPDLALVDWVRSRAHATDSIDYHSVTKSAATEKELVRKARLERFKNSMLGGLGGSLVGFGAMEGIHFLGEKQIELCRDELKLTKSEVEIVKAFSLGPKIKSCSSIRLSNPKETLKAAYEKWGFVPYGICEMALREHQTRLATFELGGEINLTCSSISGPNFKSSFAEDGTERFSCDPGAGIEYSTALGSNGAPLFDLQTTKGFFKNGERSVSADSQAEDLVSRMSVEKYSKESRLAAFTFSAFEASSSTKVHSLARTDFQRCYQNGLKFQALKNVVRLVGKCPDGAGSPNEKSDLSKSQSSRSAR